MLIHHDEAEHKTISQMLDRKIYLNIDAKDFNTNEDDLNQEAIQN